MFKPRRATRSDAIARRLIQGIVAVVGVSAAIGYVANAPLRAATISAASCAPGDVVNAVNAANAGDTVQVPAGTCIWPSSVGFSKNVRLQGVPGATIFRSNGARDQYYNNFLINWNGPFEMSGITVDGNQAIGCLYVGGGVSSGLKIHDNTFTHCRARGVMNNGLVWGVVWNNQFVDNFIDVGSFGAENAGWSTAFAYGDANTVVVEDNVFQHQTDGYRGQVLYNQQGGRIVLRHNLATGYIDYDLMDSHGNIGDWPANRGTVGAEIYENDFRLTPGTYNSWRAYYHRGGQVLMFNNRISASTGWAGIEMSEEDAWQTAFGCPCPVHDNVANAFFWNNTFNGQQVTPGYNHLPQDQTYIVLGSNFWVPSAGAQASRPGTCLPNAFYGTTDTDELYRCGLTGSWSQYYRPLAYPHPLRGDSSAVPTPPKNVRIISG
jgi:hypothetical protein